MQGSCDIVVLYRKVMQPQVDKIIFTHVCVGGALDRQAATSRYPGGFLLVDKPNERMQTYKQDADTWASDGTWQTWDSDASWAAAEGNDFDVIALGAGELL